MRLRDVLPPAVGLPSIVFIAWLFLLASGPHPHPTTPGECGTDPREILRAGELLERSSLRLIVQAHCPDARYVSDERIALRYVGAEVDVAMKKLRIGEETYYEILSVGDNTPP